jgi:hypothetical protein
MRGRLHLIEIQLFYTWVKLTLKGHLLEEVSVRPLVLPVLVLIGPFITMMFPGKIQENNGVATSIPAPCGLTIAVDWVPCPSKTRGSLRAVASSGKP